MNRRCALAALAAGALGIAAVAVPPAAAVDAEGIRTHAAAQSPGEVLAYWTPERMAAAKPLRQPDRPPAAADRPVPGTVAPAESLVAVPRPYTDPGERVHGKLFLGGGWCSASVVAAANRSLVWTAAHCLSGSPANLMFVPAYNSGGTGDAPYGRWPVLRYATSGNDHGVAVVSQLNGRYLQDVVGANGLRFDGTPVNGRTVIWGYPGRTWDGRTLTVCNAATRLSGSGVYTSCATQGGSSGGGYVTGNTTTTGLGYQWANHSAGDGATYAYGVVFGATAKRLYDANSGGPPPGGDVVWSEDFESDHGWTVNPSGTDTATSGRWERANPDTTSYNGMTLQNGVTPGTGYHDLVTGGAAGADAGANDLDGGVTSVRSPVVALPASGTLTIAFQYYLAHLDNSTSADYLRVRVAHAGGVTTVFEKTATASGVSGTWLSATADLTPYAGQSIRLLVEAADGGTGSLVEAAVDNVTVTKR